VATIRSIRWRPFSLPLRAPANAAHGVSESREGLVIVITDIEGATGLGEASPLTSYAGGTVAECDAVLTGLAKQLLGQSCRHTWDTGFEMDGVVSAGTEGAIHCGVEAALADLLASRDAVPLFRWFQPGAALNPAIAVNGLVDFASADEAAAEAARLVAAGFRTLKLKAGFGTKLDHARIAAVRAAVGADIELRVDANGAWDESTAVTMLAVCGEYGISLVEQPLPPSAGVDALARLRRTGGGIQIAADEGCRSVANLEALIAAHAVDAVVVKPMVSGLREALRIIQTATSASLPVIVTTTFDSGIGVTVATHLAATLPPPRPACGLATHERLAADIVTGVSTVVCGTVTIPSAAGLGLKLDDAALERVATGSWREVRS
jgi:o-succinylbenzoate synthase